MPSTVEVRILGAFELVVDGDSTQLAGMRQRAVLALLVLHRGHTLSLDRIVDELWTDEAPATARKAVQVYISQLRRALGDAAAVLATAEPGYRLSADVATDVDAFARLVDEGRELLTADAAHEASARFAAALALWRGEPLQDFAYEAFARDEIVRLTEQRLNAVEHRIDGDMRCGRHLELVAELDGLVSRNPLRERLRGQLMLALYRSGRQGEALEVYQSGRRALVEELGIDPGPELRRLQDAILAHDPTLAAPSRSVAVRPAPGVRRGRLAVTLGGVLLVLAAAAAAAVELTGGGSSAAFAGVPGDHVGAIDPATNTLVQEVPVGRTPTTIVVGAGAVWALNADARTISRIEPATGAVQSSNTGSTPAGIAAVPGGLWVSYPSETPDGRVRLQHIEPVTFAAGRAVALPGRGLSSGDVPLVVAGGALWAIGPQNQLDRVDLRTGRVRVAARNVGPPIAAGLGAVWTGAQGANGTTVIVRVDARTAATRRVQTPILQLEGLAVDAGAVWATDEATGSLWRIQATRPPVLQSVHVGLGAGAVAVGGGAVWVASGIDGTVSRIDIHASRVVGVVETGNTPQGIAYGAGRVWVSVAGGGGGALAGGVTVTNGAIAALPQDVCGPVFFAGTGSPKYLIASDLPFGLEAAQTRPMEEAIKFILREHRFRAGRFSIGYQSCDDSTAEAGGWTAGKCQANARSFASTPSVVGVIGTYNSGCAEEEIPITNRASLAMVSPANSYVGLTRAGPGVRPNDPAALYPAGRRTYARVYPPDDTQARAQVVLARDLARKRVFVLRDSGPGDYGGSLAASFEQAAHSAGITVVGNVRWAPSTRTNPGQATAADLRQATLLSRRIRASGAQAVDLCGLYESFGGAVIDRLRSTLGHTVVFMADDAFLADSPPPALVRAEPLYVTSGGISDPSHQLPAAGRAFVSAFRGTQPARTQDIFYVYAAQAADVLLQAIAHSDGSRPSVVSHLLKTKVNDGILGSFSFDRNGDITVDRIGVYRIAGNGKSLLLDHTIELH